MVANKGKISFERFESDTVLGRVRRVWISGPEYRARYGRGRAVGHLPELHHQSRLLRAGRIWAAMWQKYSGERIDGAVALDPTAMAYLLKVTGPASLADGQQVSAGNVVALTQQTLYSKYPDTAQRKAYLIAIAQAISKRLITAHGSKTCFPPFSWR